MMAFSPCETFAKEKVVRLGYVNSAGYQEGLEGETKTGFGYEYFQKISYYTDWKYEYVYGSFSELITKLANGEIDILGDVTYTEDRAKKMNFSSYPMGSEKYFLYTSVNNEKFDSLNTSVINGARIGIEPKKVSANLIKEWVDKFDLDVTYVECENFNDVETKTDKGEIDLFINTDAIEGYGYKPVFYIGPSDFYFAVNKNRNDLLEELNNALAIIQSSIPNYNEIVRDTYMGSSVGDAFLGKEENEWLKEHGNKLTIGYLDNNLPYSGTDENGEVCGYLSSVIDVMENKHGITVDRIAYDSLNDMYKAVQNGELDIYGPSYGTFYLSEQNGAMQSSSIMETQLAIVYGSDKPATDRIATTYQSMLPDFAVKELYPDSEITQYEDLEACMKAVYMNKADCLLIPASQLNHLRHYRQFRKLNFQDTSTKLQICLFVLKGNSGLLQILDKSIALANSELQGVDFMVDSYAENTFWDLIENNLDYVYLLQLLLFLC